ncbi:ferredoxin [Vagococcus coleopterorum]|uniref:ferredoxin n=1 Tax=Vagococcus coleopterorum TaxID=2714946 RepID=UPI001932794D|nr:ferredoxin [Vagococcus coleopterorum]
MKTTIIPEKCIACGLCQVLAPSVFDYTAEGIVIFKQDSNSLDLDVSDSLQQELMAAYKECPTRAIIVEK